MERRGSPSASPKHTVTLQALFPTADALTIRTNYYRKSVPRARLDYGVFFLAKKTLIILVI